MAEPRWLDDDEMQAWKLLLRAHARLAAALDHELQVEHGLALGDYEVLALLSEGPPDGIRMSQVAERTLLSRSGLTRRVDGLERDGLVERRACRSDRRGLMAVLTPKGRRALEAAAATHVRGVRQHFVDRLGRDDLRRLSQVLDRVVGDEEGEDCVLATPRVSRASRP